MKMKNRANACFLCYVILMNTAITLDLLWFTGAVSVNMKVEQVFWGTSADTPVTPIPGDVNLPLTVIVGNLAGNKTIKGVHAVLKLGYPFKSSSGGYEAEAVGEPREGEFLNPSGEVLPAGSFSVTFRLDIDADGKPGSYYHAMTVNYMVKEVGDRYTDGEPQSLWVKLFLPDRAPVIDSATPIETNTALYVGELMNFSSRAHDPDGDELTFRWLVDGKTVSNSSWFIYAPTSQEVGSHTVELRVSDGNLTASQVWTLFVDKLKTIDVFVPNNFLVGGTKSSLNITLRNNVWRGIVRADFSAATTSSAQSLVIYGNRSWVFNSIEPGDSISILPEVYAPSSSIGMTYTATVRVVYKNEYGRNYTDMVSVGLIVRGFVQLVAYDVEASPQPARSGSTLTITATLLNKGNIDVSNVNASIQPNPILIISSASRDYKETLEKNSREPISLRATVGQEVQNGTYLVTLSIAYQDDLLDEHTIYITTYVTVVKILESQRAQGRGDSLTSFLTDGGWPIIVLLGVAVALFLLYFRRLRAVRVQPIKQNASIARRKW